MGFDRQTVRLMAAMILAIIAYVAPSAVQAHEGHAHHGHDHAASEKVQAAPVAMAPAPSASATTTFPRTATVAAALAGLRAVLPETTASLRSDDDGRGCCPGACKGRCCGDMACCASGILPGPAAMIVPFFGTVTLTAHDVAGRAGIGPEALPRPPRTLA